MEDYSISRKSRTGLKDRTILVSVFSICLLEKAAVLICIWTGLLQAKKRGHGHQSHHNQGRSSGPARGSGAGNAGGNLNRAINHGVGGGPGGRSGGSAHGDDEDDNNGRDVIGNVENGRNPRPEERATLFLPIIIGSIAYMVSLNDAELSTTGRFIRHFSMIINLLGFICFAVVLWQPYTNPRVARLMNPRVATILSRVGSALAVLGFLSTIAIDLPTYLSWISGLAFVFLLAMFLFDMLA